MGTYHGMSLQTVTVKDNIPTAILAFVTWSHVRKKQQRFSKRQQVNLEQSIRTAEQADHQQVLILCCLCLSVCLSVCLSIDQLFDSLWYLYLFVDRWNECHESKPATEERQRYVAHDKCVFQTFYSTIQLHNRLLNRKFCIIF